MRRNFAIGLFILLASPCVAHWMLAAWTAAGWGSPRASWQRLAHRYPDLPGSSWARRYLDAFYPAPPVFRLKAPDRVSPPFSSGPDDFVARRVRHVADVGGLKAALRDARPGDDIVLAAGVYRLGSVAARVPGTAAWPIRVRAARPGSVLLGMHGQGFHVIAPWWRFQGLTLYGDCRLDARCEHAFHVVGDARGFVLRDSVMRGFNAMLKVNGVAGDYPDGGRVEGNAFVNTRPRRTARPVTFIDIVAASDWRIRRNLIANFAKAAGDRVSYGVFIKGGADGGVIENNLVVCANRGPSTLDQRVGISLGGGGSARRFCRHGCRYESRGGVIRDNLVMQCSDVGIYLNRAADARVEGNRLYNTAGIDVRYVASHADVRDNRLDGAIRERDGGRMAMTDNRFFSGDWSETALVGYRRWLERAGGGE